MRSKIPVVLALPFVVLLLTGCTAPAPAPTRTPSAPSRTEPAPSPSASVTTTPAPSSAAASSTGASGTASGEADPDRPSDQCADSALRVSISMPKGAAGSFEQDLLFTNTGSAACVLRGAPGLSVVGGGNGTQIGVAADRDQSGAKDVRLAAHGGQVYALFSGPALAPGSQGAAHCTGGVRTGDGYRVYPPHSARAFFVRDPDTAACPTGGAFLHVRVVIAQGTDY